MAGAQLTRDTIPRYKLKAPRASLFFPTFIPAGGYGPAGIGALVPVGSGPELSRRRTELQRFCRACGTYRRGRYRLVSCPFPSTPTRSRNRRTSLGDALWEQKTPSRWVSKKVAPAPKLPLNCAPLKNSALTVGTGMPYHAVSQPVRRESTKATIWDTTCWSVILTNSLLPSNPTTVTLVTGPSVEKSLRFHL
jgi:hypothetical protein